MVDRPNLVIHLGDAARMSIEGGLLGVRRTQILAHSLDIDAA